MVELRRSISSTRPCPPPTSGIGAFFSASRPSRRRAAWNVEPGESVRAGYSLLRHYRAGKRTRTFVTPEMSRTPDFQSTSSKCRMAFQRSAARSRMKVS